MIEIFTTNIQNEKEASIISGLLHLCFPNFHINIDLYDIEKVLRVESKNEPIRPHLFINYMQSLGYSIQLLK